LSPKKFEVDGYFRTPLSKIKDFGTEQSWISNSKLLL
jgi:hypothetical protein